MRVTLPISSSAPTSGVVNSGRVEPEFVGVAGDSEKAVEAVGVGDGFGYEAVHVVEEADGDFLDSGLPEILEPVAVGVAPDVIAEDAGRAQAGVAGREFRRRPGRDWSRRRWREPRET